MKHTLINIIILMVLIGCNQTKKEKVDSNDTINTESKMLKSDTAITYWQTDFDTIHKKQRIRIENDFYELIIKSYCLNDSSITRKSDYDKSKVIYHDYATEIILTLKGDTVLKSMVNKKTFSDSLSNDFYKYAVLKDVEYDFIRSNRLYFKSFLNVPDTDWGVELKFAIFYRTNKKGQIDYWNFKDIE